MVQFFKKSLAPHRVRNFQDVLYTLLILSVCASFILFLMGSTDMLSSLTVIGVLLCLSLAGGALRFLSITRADNEIADRQDGMDQTLTLMQHRVNDHDLAFLKMAGQIEGLETGLRAVRARQEKSDQRQQDFMNGMKERLLTLVTLRTRSKPSIQPAIKKPATEKKAPRKSFFPPLPAVNANPSPAASQPYPAAQKPDPAHRYEEDIYVGPALLNEAVTNAIRAQRIDTYIQPIVTLPQQKPVAFDVYGRVRLQPGVYIPARQYRGSATHAGQQIALDHLVLRDTIGLARQTAALPLFINLTREGLTEAATLSLLATLMREEPSVRSRIVLNLSQRDVTRLDEKTEAIIRRLVSMGIKFGLNDVQTTELDLNLLARLKFSYIKLPHDKLVTTRDSNDGAALIHRFLTRLQARSLTPIVSQVETHEQIRPLLDYPITLAEGYAFGRPDRPLAYQKRAA